MTFSKSRQMSWTRGRIGTAAILLACVLAGALLAAGPASAASRGFTLHNQSGRVLRLEGARRVPTFVCGDISRCVAIHYPMDFEGRPLDGSLMHPGNTQTWELKYGFSFTGGVQYAANLWYTIEGTNDSVEYTIQTYSTANESACKINGSTQFTCTAEGTKLTFK
jgi:hypothetical protein